MLNLYKAFSVIKTEKEFYNLLNDLCTPTEIRELSERWNIAQLLALEKLRQQDIATKLNCGVATVNRVSRCLKDEKNFGYTTVMTRLFPEKKLSLRNIRTNSK
ncbi:MAG: trp operon repressor [Rickettsiales bacterium]|jgi:TrpR-related protein YerC/YecD|nr:trp operon repressor [Rickettsiales bacterium]